MSKLYLYWWKDIPNVGDLASFYLIKHLSSDAIQWKNPQITFWREFKLTIKKLLKKRKFYIPNLRAYVYPWQKCIFGIGSMIEFANDRTIIWGSGFRENRGQYKCNCVKAVRGKLSQRKLREQYNIAIGDPALLLPLVYTPLNKSKGQGLKIVPHYADYAYIYEKYHSRYDIIDVRTGDVESFINQIVSSKYILSTSLHGLIISHAYGIPALWIKHGYIYSSDFKFYDYFSSVNIEAYTPFTNIDEILESTDSIEILFNSHKNLSHINVSLHTMQIELLSVAPFNLKDEYQKLLDMHMYNSVNFK